VANDLGSTQQKVISVGVYKLVEQELNFKHSLHNLFNFWIGTAVFVGKPKALCMLLVEKSNRSIKFDFNLKLIHRLLIL